nr:structural protein [Tolivirales sp.]
MAKSKKQIVVKVQPSKSKKTKQKDKVSAIGQALRVLGGIGGGAAGAFLGHGDLGRQAGTSLGAAISRWLGTGDYTVRSNTIVQSLKSSESIPAMHVNGQSVVIRHKEFVGEIRGSVNFRVRQSFFLNPGLAASYPWLSAVANSFQEYRIRGMVYHYVPSSGAVVSTSPALGTVMIQTSYRSTDSAPGQKLELLNEYNASESVPSEAFCHPIECDPRENPFNVQYVRSRDVPAGDNRMLYDLGVTHVAVSGQQANDQVLGDLWVTYEVELKKPIVTSNITTDMDYFVAEGSFSGAGTIGGAGLNIFPNTFVGYPLIRGTMNVTLSNNNIIFPVGSRGKFQITGRYYASGAFTFTTGFGIPSVNNCSLYSPFGIATIFNSTRVIQDNDDIVVIVLVDLDTGDPLNTRSIQFSPVDIPFTTGTSWVWTVTRLL